MINSELEAEIIKYMESVSQSELKTKKSKPLHKILFQNLQSQWSQVRGSMEQGITAICHAGR